ncbi:MAG: efflux RND transporter periplasmic adaptor subunit [Gammaproteobacteria bacterium]|nr:efflux RND transporter periplasmic adaptor subunit [Gammaproteobacteria bacterium]
MKSARSSIIGIAVVLLAALATACGKTGDSGASTDGKASAVAAAPAGTNQGASDGKSPRASLVVTTAQARSETLPAVIAASGAVAAWQEASVGSRSSGLPIVAINAEIGDTVKKGQVLARLDDSTTAAAVARAEAQLAQARAREDEARINRDRALQLAERKLLSQQDVLQATTNAAAATAEVAQAAAMLRSARLDHEHTRVVAPDDGIVIARSATLGAVAQPGTELFRLIRQGRLEWRAELTGEQLMQVRPGTVASVRSSDGTEVRGKVRTVAPALDNAKRIGIAYVDLEPSSAIRSAMYLQGELQLAERQAMTVPAASVVVRDGRSYVAVVAAGDRVRLVPVVAGRRTADRTQIESGLEAGTTVVVRGAGFLNDGDVVRIAPAG